MRALSFALVALVAGPLMAGESAAPAQDNAPRLWQALSGERLELEGEELRLSGVSCPAPDTEEGRRARALLNTFLRGGLVVCEVAGERARCAKEGRDAAAGLIASGSCEAREEVAWPEAEALRVLTKDTRPGLRQAENRAGCDRRGAGAAFVAGAAREACDRGVPGSVCAGRTGLRQGGAFVAPSDGFRATGEGAPRFAPFGCR
ncbi:MAG: hypothetical protein RIG84_05585 [Roseovarius sp.]